MCPQGMNRLGLGQHLLFSWVVIFLNNFLRGQISNLLGALWEHGIERFMWDVVKYLTSFKLVSCGILKIILNLFT